MSTYTTRTDGDSLDFIQDATTNFALQNTAANNLTVAGTASNVVMVSNIQVEDNEKTLTSADSPYTMTKNDQTLYCDTTNGDITINLEAVATARRIERNVIKTKAANSVFLDPNASEKINNSTSSFEITSTHNSIVFKTDGTEWFLK